MITSIILKLLNEKQLKIKASIELFFRLFTNQSSNLLIRYKLVQGLNKTKNKLIIILLVILIQSILIINQQLTNSLLDIYFNIKTLSLFNNFEEICNNRDISVKTTIFNTQLNSDDKVCNHDLEKRTNFEIVDSWKNLLFNEKILLDVINGKSVLIAPSYLSQNIQRIYELKNHIIFPDDR